MGSPISTETPPGAVLRLPWRVRTLPRWVFLAPGFVYLASVVLYPFKPQYLCEDPWEGANLLLWPVDLALALMLLKGTAQSRRLAALFGHVLSCSAMVLLTFLRLFGRRLNLAAAEFSCGCFGPIDLPYPVHMALLAGMAACLAAVFLHEETVLTGGEMPSTATRIPTGAPETGNPASDQGDAEAASDKRDAVR